MKIQFNAPQSSTLKNPSIYQEGIFTWVKVGMGNALVNAVAGSGKTTTLVHALGLMAGEAVFMAFNTHIVTELRNRLPAHQSAMTLHSFGLNAIRRRNRDAKVNQWKDRDIISEHFASVFRRDEKDRIRDIAIPTADLARMARLTMTDLNDQKALVDLIVRFDIQFDSERDIKDAIPAIPVVVKKMRADLDKIDFTDMLDLPVALGLQTAQYDVVAIDEAQDLSAAQRELALRAARAGGRTLAVGDPKQAIQGFAGADVKSMDKLHVALKATSLPLSICYRCPRSHVALAKALVSHIEASPTAKDGVVEHATFKTGTAAMKPGDLVICRTNAPLVGIALNLARQGIPCKIKGADLKRSFHALITKAEKKMRGATMKALQRSLEDMLEKELDAMGEEAEKGRGQALTDKYETLIFLAGGASSVPELDRMLDSLFSDEMGPVVRLSTVHRAKGLEADNVFIYNEKLMPLPFAQGEDLQQEWNIRYVALTRSKDRLTFVEPKAKAKR